MDLPLVSNQTCWWMNRREFVNHMTQNRQEFLAMVEEMWHEMLFDPPWPTRANIAWEIELLVGVWRLLEVANLTKDVAERCDVRVATRD